MTIKGEDIKKYRKSNKLSQTEMAKMAGVSPRTIQNYEAGTIIPKSKQSLLQGIIQQKHDNENTDNKECRSKGSNNENDNKNADNEKTSVRSNLNDSITDYITKNDDHIISPPEHRALLIKAINRMAEAMKTVSEASERNSKTFETLTNHLINHKELTIHEVNEIISKLNDQEY